MCAYTSLQDMSHYIPQIAYSLSISFIIHFCIFILGKFFIRNRTVFNIFLIIGSIILLLFCAAFYTGMKSWGAPMNVAIVKSGHHDFPAMISLASSKIGFCLLFIITVNGIYLSYVNSSKKLFNNPDSDIKRVGNNMFFKAIFLPVLLLAGILFGQWSIGSNNKKKFKYEIFSSFLKNRKSYRELNSLIWV